MIIDDTPLPTQKEMADTLFENARQTGDHSDLLEMMEDLSREWEAVEDRNE